MSEIVEMLRPYASALSASGRQDEAEPIYTAADRIEELEAEVERLAESLVIVGNSADMQMARADAAEARVAGLVEALQTVEDQAGCVNMGGPDGNERLRQCYKIAHEALYAPPGPYAEVVRVEVWLEAAERAHMHGEFCRREAGRGGNSDLYERASGAFYLASQFEKLAAALEASRQEGKEQ